MVVVQVQQAVPPDGGPPVPGATCPAPGTPPCTGAGPVTREQIVTTLDVRLERLRKAFPEAAMEETNAMNRMVRIRGAIQELEALRRDIDEISEDGGRG